MNKATFFLILSIFTMSCVTPAERFAKRVKASLLTKTPSIDIPLKSTT